MAFRKDMALHITMYPWFAIGHLNVYIGIANKLAEKGHRISSLVPSKTMLKIAPHNHYPHLITFIPIAVPAVDGLPVGSETNNDTPPEFWPLLMTAMDLTQETLGSHLSNLRPDFVFCDFAHWLPDLARKHRVKSVYYLSSYLVPFAYMDTQARNLPYDHLPTEVDYMTPPPSFPSPSMMLHKCEARHLANGCSLIFGGMTLFHRVKKSFRDCDAIGAKTFRELEGAYCNFTETTWGKPVLLAGPNIPESPSSALEEHLDSWLNGFDAGTVVYCALGSEFVLDKSQFQELVLGLELTGRPFLAALKPPTGSSTIESALPTGFAERIQGRGIVTMGWVQQQQVLQHSSVGCFLGHCGTNSMSEALVSDCQIVLIPQTADQFIHSRMMSMDLKMGIEVDKNPENGFFTQQAIHKAISTVMDPESEVGIRVKENHAKWKEIMLKPGLESSYIDSFIQNLRGLMEP